MTTPSVLGNLTTFGYNTAGSGSYTAVNNVKSITPVNPEFTIVPMGGLADSVEVKTIGFLDNKGFSVELYHTTANFTLATATWAALTSPGSYQITTSDSHTYTFLAWFKGYKTKMDRNQAVIYSCEFDVTGAVTYT